MNGSFVFHYRYVWSGLIVVLGIYLNVYSKKHKLTFADINHKIKQCFYRLGKTSSSSRKFLVEV